LTKYNPLEGERPNLILDLNDSVDEKVSIIVVHNDRPEYLNLCLQSITVASINNNYELIVVDNGSDAVSQGFLSDIEQDGVKVVRNDSNKFWTTAANQGALAADKDSKYLIFMHHDVMVINPTWIDLLANVAESKKSGVIGVEYQAYEYYGQRLNFIYESCMLVTRECWKDCGPFNEEFPQVGSSFLFTYLANSKGYNPQIVQNPCIHHWRTAAIDINEFERLAEQARAAMPKWLQKIQSGAV
jgi:glycosyltransferase involved in cell wall biosynthesis